MIRDLILTLTILALIFIAAHQPAPVKTVQVDYCKVTYKARLQNPRTGKWEWVFYPSYGPCTLLDRYENT